MKVIFVNVSGCARRCRVDIELCKMWGTLNEKIVLGIYKSMPTPTQGLVGHFSSCTCHTKGFCLGGQARG